MQDGLLRDVLDGFHHAGEEVAVGGLAGRKGHTAVAEQRRGDTVPAYRRDVAVPADLGVHVGVQVNEAGRYLEPIGLNLLDALAGHLSDLGDLIAVDRDVRGEGFGTGAVNDGTTANDEVVAHELSRS